MKKRNVIIIISFLVVVIIALSVILILNNKNKNVEKISEELKRAQEKYDIRLNSTKDEYIIYGLKPTGSFENHMVVIPDTIDNIPVTRLQDSVDFTRYQDKDIKTIVIGKNIKYISGSITSNYSNNEFGQNIFINANSLVNIEVATGNVTFSSENGILYNYDKTILIKYPKGKGKSIDDSSHNFTIPESVKYVYDHAFYGNQTLESVDFGRNVIKIGIESFAGCKKLSSVKFNDQLLEIDKRSFYSCSSLVSIYLNSGISKLSRGLFSKCDNLTTIYIPSTIREDGFEDEVFTGCNNISRIYTDDGNVEYLKTNIKKYAIFANLSENELNQLIIVKK